MLCNNFSHMWVLVINACQVSASLWVVSLIFNTKHGRGWSFFYLRHNFLNWTYSTSYLSWSYWICVISRLKSIKILMALLKKWKMKIQRILIFKLVNLIFIFFFFLRRHMKESCSCLYVINCFNQILRI